MTEVAWTSYMPEYCVKTPELSAERVIMIQGTWEQLLKIAAAGGDPLKAVGEAFYKELFEIAPASRVLFNDNMDAQVSKLGNMLNAAVGLLDKDLPSLVKVLQDLATRHHQYGTRPEHYSPVGLALVGALSKTLGPEIFNDDVKTAWVHLYSQIVCVMMPITFKMTQ